MRKSPTLAAAGSETDRPLIAIDRKIHTPADTYEAGGGVFRRDGRPIRSSFAFPLSSSSENVRMGAALSTAVSSPSGRTSVLLPDETPFSAFLREHSVGVRRVIYVGLGLLAFYVFAAKFDDTATGPSRSTVLSSTLK